MSHIFASGPREKLQSIFSHLFFFLRAETQGTSCLADSDWGSGPSAREASAEHQGVLVHLWWGAARPKAGRGSWPWAPVVAWQWPGGQRRWRSSYGQRGGAGDLQRRGTCMLWLGMAAVEEREQRLKQQGHKLCSAMAVAGHGGALERGEGECG
jgi:hypothetical protein